MIPLWLVGAGAFAWFVLLWWTLGLMRARAREYAPPPARPRIRVERSRENVGVVHVLPSVGDAENGWKVGRG